MSIKSYHNYRYYVGASACYLKELVFIANKNFVIFNELKDMDNEISVSLKNVPFDKGLPIIRKYVWAIADRHNTTGAEIFKMYMEYLSDKNQEKE